VRPQSYYRIAKEGSWIVIGEIAAVLGALAMVRLLTEYLEPAQYGRLALGLTVAGMVNQAVMGGVTAGIGRFYSIAAEKQCLDGYWRASRRMMTYATAVAITIGLLLMAGLLWSGNRQWLGLAGAALVLSILSAYNNALSGIQNAARQRAVVAFTGGMDAWLKILFALAAICWLGNSGTAVLIGYALSSLLITGSQFFFLGRIVPVRTDAKADVTEWTRRMWSYSWPFSAWGIFTWLQQSSDRWALEAFATTREVGMYAVLFQLGYIPISLATGLMMSFLGPILYQRSGDATDRARNANVHRLSGQVTLLIVLLTITGVLLALLLHKWIFRLLVASEYRSVSALLPWVVLAGGLFAAGQMMALKLMSDMKSAAMTTAKIITASLGVLLNIYCASVAGLPGIVGALVGFSSLYFLWMAFLTLRPSAATSGAQNSP
jgi:O-antigen/teichoic acid export membrane protein